MKAEATSATFFLAPPVRLRPVGVDSGLFAWTFFAGALAGAWFSLPPEKQQIILTFYITMNYFDRSKNISAPKRIFEH